LLKDPQLSGEGGLGATWGPLAGLSVERGGGAAAESRCAKAALCPGARCA
jgi:hypothetical protein